MQLCTDHEDFARAEAGQEARERPRCQSGRSGRTVMTIPTLMVGLIGFTCGCLIGLWLTREKKVTPTGPPKDYPTTNAGFGPDYPFQKDAPRKTK